MNPYRAIFHPIVVVACSIFVFAHSCVAQTSLSTAVDVRLVTDEAEAVLNILAKEQADQTITDAGRRRVFQSEGYVRLRQRETAMNRSFEDADFKTFALSDKLLGQKQALEETLGRWKRADTTGAARPSLAYSPKVAPVVTYVNRGEYMCNPSVAPFNLLSVGVAGSSRTPSNTYQDTRKLLSQMKGYDLHPERLAELFRIGDARVGDLVKALDDPDKEISVNAQTLIRYLGNDAGLKGLNKYYESRRKAYLTSGPIPIPLIDEDYKTAKSNLPALGEEYIYALLLDDSARARELLASLVRSNNPPSSDTLIGRALMSAESVDPKRALTGDPDVAKLVMGNAFFVSEVDKQYASARLVGYNGAKDKAVVEVFINRGVISGRVVARCYRQA